MIKVESYSDQIRRLFPPEQFDSMHINGSHVKSITFQVTEDCNLRCSYCYQHNKTHNKMTFDVAKRFIDMILSSDERSNKYITADKSQGAIIEFIGGEPFLEIDLIDQITDYFIEQVFLKHHPWANRYRISISSNGLLYFDERVQNYIKKNFEHLSLGISIDGDKELHDSCRIDANGQGSYDRAMAAVKHYHDTYGVQISSKMTIAPGNVVYIAKAVISMIENGYKDINLNCVYEEGWTNEHAKILYEQIKILSDYLIENNLLDDIRISLLEPEYVGKPLDPDNNNNWCGGNGLMIAVDYKGDIFPCLRYMGSSLGDRQEPYVIGNVYDGIMTKKVWCDRVDCLGCITRRSQSTDECFNCPIASGCAWCTAYNYEVTGTPNKRLTYICVMHKARVLGISYLWNNWYRKIDSNKRYKLNIPREWAMDIIGREEFDYLLKLSEGGEDN